MTPSEHKINGMPVYLNENLIVRGPDVRVRRSWRERICQGFLSPYTQWTPWVAHKQAMTFAPDMAIYQTPDGSLHCHPAALEHFQERRGQRLDSAHLFQRHGLAMEHAGE